MLAPRPKSHSRWSVPRTTLAGEGLYDHPGLNTYVSLAAICGAMLIAYFFFVLSVGAVNRCGPMIKRYSKDKLCELNSCLPFVGRVSVIAAAVAVVLISSIMNL